MRMPRCRSTAPGCCKLRDRLSEATTEPITPFVLTLRLLVVALGRHPILNSTWVDTVDGPRIHVQSGVHLGVGVAAPRGLLVPVVADAQDKTTRELAAMVTRLIADARAGTLKPVELQGSTFTVSNFGALGLDEGVPVINHPEAAILGIGSLKPASRGRRRRRRRPPDDDAHVRVRPPGRRRRPGGRFPVRASRSRRVAGTGAARPLTRPRNSWRIFIGGQRRVKSQDIAYRGMSRDIAYT